MGKGVDGSGGGGGGVEEGGGRNSGSVVNGSDWASLKRAQPLDTNIAVHSAATSPRRTDRRIRMTVQATELLVAAATSGLLCSGPTHRQSR